MSNFTGHMSDYISKEDLEQEAAQEPKYNPPKILRNRAQCLKCGDIIESKSVRDFQTCSCGKLSVDGGHQYLHRVFAPGMYAKDWKELSEYELELDGEKTAATLGKELGRR